jgi:O-antigen ligase
MTSNGTILHPCPPALPARDTWLSVSSVKNALALGYLATSVAPALYLPPVMLVLMLALAAIEALFLKMPHARAPYVRPLTALLAVMFVSALASGLGPADILAYDAIRYDSNILYSAIPLFVLGSGDFNLRRLDRWIRNIVIWGAVAYVALPLVGFQPYESHNAAGGFFMVLLAYLVGRAIVAGFAGRWAAIAIGAIALVLTDSRGSIIAILAAVAYDWSSRRWPRLSRALLLAFVAVLICGLAVAYYVWQEMGAPIVYDYSEFSSVSDQLPTDMMSLGERPGTIMHRLFLLYPMAIDMFLQSPIVGIGFSRFDDFPVQISGIPGVLAMNTATPIHSNLHAHNSFLHIAAENGIVGLALLFLTIRAIYRTFASRELYTPVAMILGSLLFASLTEHRLTTPSQAAPAFVIVGLLWACQRSRRQ